MNEVVQNLQCVLLCKMSSLNPLQSIFINWRTWIMLLCTVVHTILGSTTWMFKSSLLLLEKFQLYTFFTGGAVQNSRANLLNSHTYTVFYIQFVFFLLQF